MKQKKTVQTLANLLTKAVGLDVGITSKDRITIAGTGTFKKNIGLKVPRYCYAAKTIATEKLCFVKDPKFEPDCYKCKLRNACPYNMALINPILSNERVEGSIAFLSTNEKQRNFMANSKNYLIENLEHISYAIVNNVLNDNFDSTFNDIKNNFNAIMDSLEVGLLIAGEMKNIEYLNPVAEKIIGYEKKDILGVNIEKLLKEKNSKHSFSLEGVSYNSDIIHNINKIMKKDNLPCYLIHLKQESRGKNYGPISSGNIKTFEKIIGKSASIKTSIKLSEKIINLDSPVLLLGETGTGKDLFARAIHDASNRNDKNFITLNCSAVPENLLESEMFGYEEGAFTGAKKGGKIGKFQQAHEGTFFLDEIGDMPKILQSKLLKIIEDYSVERLGGTKAEKVNVRIIAATNQNLEEMICKGTFRKDLFYRLNVFPIKITPLRERKEDILLLASHFLSLFHSKLGISPKVLSSKVKNIFLNYSWNGNVRELKNVIEYMVQISQKNTIEVEDIPEYLRRQVNSEITTEEDYIPLKHRNELQVMEKSVIEKALKKFGSSTEGKRKTSQYLGISLATLYRRLQYYGINL